MASMPHLHSQDKLFARAVSNLPLDLREAPVTAGMERRGLLHGYPRTLYSQLGLRLAECNMNTGAKLFDNPIVDTYLYGNPAQSVPLSRSAPLGFLVDRGLAWIAFPRERTRESGREKISPHAPVDRNAVLGRCSGRSGVWCRGFEWWTSSWLLLCRSGKLFI